MKVIKMLMRVRSRHPLYHLLGSCNADIDKIYIFFQVDKVKVYVMVACVWLPSQEFCNNLHNQDLKNNCILLKMCFCTQEKECHVITPPKQLQTLFISSLLDVSTFINHKPPPHKPQLRSPTKYRCYPCQHYITLGTGWMDLVDYGYLNLSWWVAMEWLVIHCFGSCKSASATISISEHEFMENQATRINIYRPMIDHP